MNNIKKCSMPYKKYTIFDCSILHLPRIKKRQGNITPITNFENIPFAIQRIYYLYDMPGGESRGAHAHKNLEQLIIAASGSFDISIDDGKNRKTVNLAQPYMGLHMRPGIWRDLHNFSSGAICLVLASAKYDEEDYIKDYDNFLALKNL
jgi:hypothetical protein